MSDATEVLTVQEGQAAVKQVAVSGEITSLPSATDVKAIVQTDKGPVAAIKTVSLGGGGGGAGGDYLPLSGGNMIGDIGFGSSKLGYSGVNVVLKTSSGSMVFAFNVSQGYFYSPLGDIATLGARNYKWLNVFTKKLNNGADIAIPKEGGTLARIEDINAAVGDISTALTAIIGE